MSTPFPKSKEKRPRSPNEPNKPAKERMYHAMSFVKNVTSRVSGLLPATITKWFSSPSSNKNGSAQVTEATDSSTEDEAPESPITTQPPAKKIRYSGDFSQYLPVETRCTSTNTETIDEISTVQSPIGNANSREESIITSTHIQSVNDGTTETCVYAGIDETEEKDKIFTQQHSLSTIEPSMAKKRKSLFGTPPEDSVKKYGWSRSGNARDPHFKPSLLTSPFYDGRTMYGGAATSSYLTPTSFKKKTISLTNETNNNDSVTMSHSARRVMDLLEHYSSPIIEAKRIPQITRKPEIDNDNFLPQCINPYGLKQYSYKTQELHVPSVANILSIKRRSRLMDSTNAARQIIASHSSSSEFLPYSMTSSGCDMSDEVMGDKLTTKVKSRLTRTNRERNIEMESPSDIVNLPNVVLQIDKDNLPKFTFGPTSSQPQQSSSIQTPVIITPEALKRSNESDKSGFSKVLEKAKTLEVKSNNEQYKFSTPVQISNESNKTTSTPPKFSFGSPDKKLSNTEKLDEVETTGDSLFSNTSNQTNLDNIIQAEICSDWKCPDCWVNNKTNDYKCVCCGQSKPVEDNEPKSWRCQKCGIKNTAKKCACCGYKILESDWVCEKCEIVHSHSSSNCTVCGDLKPVSNTITENVWNVPSPVEETQDSTFKDIAKAQNEKWECPLCLVRNESDKDICICCEASKPGTEKQSQTKFNFHQPSEITFKFGIQPNQETYTSMEPEECSMGESETNNNILPKTPTFNFGLPVKNLDDQSHLMDKLPEAPKLNFTFGLLKGDQVSSGRNILFGIPSKPVESGKSIEENPQEVPQVFTRLQSNDSVKKNSEFNTSVTSQMTSGISGLVPMHLLNQNSAVNQDSPFGSGISTTSSKATTQSNLILPSNMTATNMFAAEPTTTPTVSTISPRPHSMDSLTPSKSWDIFKPKITTTTSSFFKKTDPLPASSMTLLSKTESITTTTTTTTAGPLGTIGPIFNFGGQGSVPQAEQPKFNFNFTTNKPESATIFGPTFGVTSDNSIGTNKFNLPSNTILGGNTLSGNPLNTTSQMNTTNPLTTGNSLTTPSGSTIFGSTVPKENMWSTNNNNMFANNNTTNGEQNPPTFTFGAATTFSTNTGPFGSTAQQAQPSNSPFGGTTQAQTNNNAFGNTAQQAQPNNNGPFGSALQQAPSNNVPFGNTQQQVQPNMNAPFGSTPQQAQQNNNILFGNNPQQAQSNIAFGTTTQQTQPLQNLFGMGGQTTSQPTMFGNHLQNQPPQNLFGGLQVPNNPMPMGMFGAPNQVPTPGFGAMNAPVPTFETAAPPQPAPPTFNFGAQQSTAIFGFGQQQQQQAPAQQENPGIYGFGCAPGAPRVQFTIGSAPDNSVRRVRKAMRRTQR